ncbi:MAG: serine/threonine-protein kinase [Luteolibacter sp.]
MDSPKVDGLKIDGLIGHGGCGRVYRATDEKGQRVAVKLFEAMAIHRPLLSKMTERLENGGWPEGVIPVFSADFSGRPALWVTPWHEELHDDLLVPRTLQRRIDEYPGEHAWPLVRKIAAALAAMHERQVPHGNLKPGNVFFDDNGHVQLTDWAVGNIPGTSHFEFTDALLYQAPEQLSNPEGYLDEAGYRWDVYAFGALSYRLLTGRFPRCHDTFIQVAPAAHETRKEGIHAELPKIAKNLLKQPEIEWPDERANALEAAFRGLIMRCLSLEPVKRPATMSEVVAELNSTEQRLATAEEKRRLLEQRQLAERRARRALLFAGAAVAIALVFGSLWQLADYQKRRERHEREENMRALKAAAVQSTAAKEKAEASEKKILQELAYEKELGIARLEASRQIGDRLFSWAMEKGQRKLPPLDGRELRLKRLERYFEDFLTRTANIPMLEDERARATLQLAEISLAAGDEKQATGRISTALAAWKNQPVNAELKLRMATNSLLLALLQQSTNSPETGNAFTSARQALTEVPKDGIDADRLTQLVAILDFHEAQYLSLKGDDTKALNQLLRATQTLNQLALQRPDAAVLRSELASCYLSSATILEGMGNIGDAREVRNLAVAEIQKILKTTPNDPSLRMDLAGCYSAMAEAAVLSGDTVAADSLNQEALKMLDRLLGEQPDLLAAEILKASQLGLRAGLLRDRGQSADALKLFDDGIRILESARATSGSSAMATYRLAQLWWQKGRMLGAQGNRQEEIRLETKAGESFASLEALKSTDGPRLDQIQKAEAYLMGDLGLALQLSGNKEQARQVFAEAVNLWEMLLKSRPQSEEFDEGLSWCRQRLAELQ